MRWRAAQHLLSAVADVVTGADTAGWELRPSSSDGAADAVLVELETDALSPEQVCAIESLQWNSPLRAVTSSAR